MEESQNSVFNGLSPDARRNNVVDTSASTPRDKENEGANSTGRSQIEAGDQSKGISNAENTSALPASLPVRTPAKSRVASHAARPGVAPTRPPSPASVSITDSALKDSTPVAATKNTHSQQESFPSVTTPVALSSSFYTQKSPPGTSQVLRKHFQSLGFATPPGKQRILSTGAVRLTPQSRKKPPKGSRQAMAFRRVGYDGTDRTPSKELLKSTASSRHQRVQGLQDMSMEQQLNDDDHNDNHPLIQQHSALGIFDDESSNVPDDASFDISLPSMNHNSLLGSSGVMPAPHSPLTPRMGCLNPVALTLLNDGKEDYQYLLTQDALFPVPKVEDVADSAGPQANNTSMSSSSSASSVCLSPTPIFAQSPAEVRDTLSQKVRSTLARPKAIIAKGGRVSPTMANQPISHPRLAFRPSQPKHVR